MLNFIFKFLTVFFSLFFLIALHIGLSYILPFPFSKINIIFIFLIIFLMWKDSGLIVWISFLIHFALELYSTTPFGVILFSSTISTLLIFWLYKNFFTNRSWYSAMTLVFLLSLFYRFFYIFFLKVIDLIKGIDLSWNLIYITSFWEILLTAITTAIIYLLLSILIKEFKKPEIKKGIFKI